MRRIFKRLDRLYESSHKIWPVKKIVFFSDLHQGDGGPADDFEPNRIPFQIILNEYSGTDWLIIYVGDTAELFQFNLRDIKQVYLGPQAYLLGGNHDIELGLPESLVIAGDPPIFVIHGHQAGDFFNYELWKLAKFFTRHIWKPLEYFGLKDPPSTKSAVRHDRSRRKLKAWANSRGVRVVCGHHHFQEEAGLYYDIGSSVKPGFIQRIELQKNILTLKGQFYCQTKGGKR